MTIIQLGKSLSCTIDCGSNGKAKRSVFSAVNRLTRLGINPKSLNIITIWQDTSTINNYLTGKKTFHRLLSPFSKFHEDLINHCSSYVCLSGNLKDNTL
jgi:hypothetical protein